MENLTENNKFIAEFMDIVPNPGSLKSFKGRTIYPVDATKDDFFKFHNSWDWLMPVVEKIESLPNELCNEYFWNKEDSKKRNDFRIFRVSKIHDLYNEVIEFIKWFNENKDYTKPKHFALERVLQDPKYISDLYGNGQISSEPEEWAIDSESGDYSALSYDNKEDYEHDLKILLSAKTK